MDPRLTQFLAIWGAVISTIAFIWQVYQWKHSVPRIAVRAEILESCSTGADDLIFFELRNRGRQPTTVEEIMFIEHRSWYARITRIPDHLENIWVGHEKTMRLPVVLQPGQMWKGHCPLDAKHESRMFDGKTRRQRFNEGRLRFASGVRIPTG
jgi:hypothetical protein